MADIPSTGVNPVRQAQQDLENAMREFDFLKSELESERRQNREYIDLNARLCAELDTIRSALKIAEDERRRFQNYAIDLTTRLDVISETIVNAKSEARKFGMKPAATVEPVDRLDDQSEAELSMLKLGESANVTAQISAGRKTLPSVSWNQ